MVGRRRHSIAGMGAPGRNSLTRVRCHGSAASQVVFGHDRWSRARTFGSHERSRVSPARVIDVFLFSTLTTASCVWRMA